MHRHQHEVLAYFRSHGVGFDEVSWLKDPSYTVVDGKWCLNGPSGSHPKREVLRRAKELEPAATPESAPYPEGLCTATGGIKLG